MECRSPCWEGMAVDIHLPAVLLAVKFGVSSPCYVWCTPLSMSRIAELAIQLVGQPEGGRPYRVSTQGGAAEQRYR